MTIKDLAAQTGYSVGTVSRVLNNQSHVSEQARQTILRAAAECGFHLNANAKQLKQQHSNSILLISKGTANELFDTLIVAIQSHIAETPYQLIVDYVDESANVVRRALQLCPEKKPLGIVFLGGNREEFLGDFQKITLPCVLITSLVGNLPFSNLSCVSADDAQSARMAIDHLAALGHKKIVIIGGNRTYSDVTRQRYFGCLDAFRQHRISFMEDRDYETARYTFADSYRATQALLKKNPDFTALFAMSDVMALGAIRALADAGKRVPEDVSVIGFDGLAMGEYTVPRLSTISQPVQELAHLGMELLRQNLEGTPSESHRVVPVTLIHRESTRKL